jgi:hypothetical protein
VLDVWKRRKPHCDRRASFTYGSTGGHMGHVPIAAGIEATAIVGAQFNRALERLAGSSGTGCASSRHNTA